MSYCFFGQFSERVRWAEAFEDSDLEVVVKVLLFIMESDTEFLGNVLAV